MTRFFKKFWHRRDTTKKRLGEDVWSKEEIEALDARHKADEEAELADFEDDMFAALEEAEKNHKTKKSKTLNFK